MLLLFGIYVFDCPVCRKDVDMYRTMSRIQWNYEAQPPEISGCILVHWLLVELLSGFIDLWFVCFLHC